MPALTSLAPVRCLEGGRLWLRGDGFPQPESTADLVTIGGVPARLAFASPDRLAVIVPTGLEGGAMPVKVAWVPGATLYAQVGSVLATGLHQVDNPVFGPDGALYVTYSGSRGQEASVSVFRIPANGGARAPFVHGLVNPTSMAIGPDGRLYVSSRFEGRVYRVFDDGRYEVKASDLGVACGLAFDAEGALYVGDRGGTIFRILPSGRTETFATVPSSVAAFHLAMSPDGYLYVSAPTLASYDSVRRISPNGVVETLDVPFGRPQGLAFDAAGTLHVVEALAGASGVFAIRPGSPPELLVAGAGLVGVAFGSDGRMAVASNESIFSFATDVASASDVASGFSRTNPA
ncbi:MAG: gluconolaconase [Acidobacterium sp.]|nr:gluconolaconase [Acidobacteriota bacterium]PHY11569.1 MAG: gluconolaconase [Acidobacterium sp.]